MPRPSISHRYVSTLFLTLPHPPLQATYNIDLTPHPEFSLSLPKENWSPDEYEQSPLIKIDADGRPTAQGLSKVASVRMSRRMSSNDLKFKAPKMAEAGNKFQVRALALNMSSTSGLCAMIAAAVGSKFKVKALTVYMSYGVAAFGGLDWAPQCSHGTQPLRNQPPALSAAIVLYCR